MSMPIANIAKWDEIFYHSFCFLLVKGVEMITTIVVAFPPLKGVYSQ